MKFSKENIMAGCALVTIILAFILSFFEDRLPSGIGRLEATEVIIETESEIVSTVVEEESYIIESTEEVESSEEIESDNDFSEFIYDESVIVPKFSEDTCSEFLNNYPFLRNNIFITVVDYRSDWYGSIITSLGVGIINGDYIEKHSTNDLSLTLICDSENTYGILENAGVYEYYGLKGKRVSLSNGLFKRKTFPSEFKDVIYLGEEYRDDVKYYKIGANTSDDDSNSSSLLRVVDYYKNNGDVNSMACDTYSINCNDGSLLTYSITRDGNIFNVVKDGTLDLITSIEMGGIVHIKDLDENFSKDSGVLYASEVDCCVYAFKSDIDLEKFIQVEGMYKIFRNQRDTLFYVNSETNNIDKISFITDARIADVYITYYDKGDTYEVNGLSVKDVIKRNLEKRARNRGLSDAYYTDVDLFRKDIDSIRKLIYYYEDLSVDSVYAE